ncbi:hypothetical protein TNCV_1014011 [Trichonephila clavipes]|uniref:Uncharacterized protein n=1 Tax=Trichonephila clavipes TaxID=2585209 RepID=A0A8X6VXF5_TRICX|nr:hypothetical protein TNCV_1014011 [Trichonephila clavipes]
MGAVQCSGNDITESSSSTSFYKVTRGLLATDVTILSFRQVTRPTSELAPPLQTSSPRLPEDFELDRFDNIHLYTEGLQRKYSPRTEV